MGKSNAHLLRPSIDRACRFGSRLRVTSCGRIRPAVACLALAALLLAGGCRSKGRTEHPSGPKRNTSVALGSGDARWYEYAPSGDWNTPANWDPEVVPTNTAYLDWTQESQITFASGSIATVNGISFGTYAPSYTLSFQYPATSPALTIAGVGVTSNSSNPQNFVVASTASSYQNAQLAFRNNATAGGPGVYYSAGPATASGTGGGVIGFYNGSTAGSAHFTTTTGSTKPPYGSTVGGEISFSDSSNAGTAHFENWGTTGTDGDTFGNTVFHDTSTAQNGQFDNAGGTVKGGDGGNTQFYDTSTAANGKFYNHGGKVYHANGGDVAFDGTATGGNGQFHNYPAEAEGAYGGVTSFNNNPPGMSPSQGASAGTGFYFNYGARGNEKGGGGHTEFTARHGWPTAGNAAIINYGCEVQGVSASSAGHTIFSVNLPNPNGYRPTAGNAILWNYAGTVAGAPGGYTEFAVYSSHGAKPAQSADAGPTGGNGTFINMGALVMGAIGGSTSFSDGTTAGSAQLIAVNGLNGAPGGTITFQGTASGGSALVQLHGNGVLDITRATTQVTIGILSLWYGGTVQCTLGTSATCLGVSNNLVIHSGQLTFAFSGTATSGTPYAVLTAPNLSQFTPDQFTGNSVSGLTPSFSIDSTTNTLNVTFQ